MTIETGVVKGNIDRVTTEIKQFIAEAESKGHQIDNLKTKFDQLQLRAESFLKHLGQLDETAALQTKAPEALQSTTTATSDEAIKPTDPEPVGGVSPESVTESAQSQPEPIQPNDGVESTQKDEQSQSSSDLDEVRMQLDTIQVQLSEVLLRLDQLTTGEPTNSSEGGDLIDQALENPDLISPEFIRDVMTTYGEDIMKRDKKIKQFWQTSLNQAVFNNDQKKVLDHLHQYQTRLHSDESAAVLPSPWDRGMKDLFSD